MRFFLALVLLAAVAGAETPRFKRFTTRTPQGRTQRGLINSVNLPAFSALTASGAGTFGPCSATAPTGSRGETLASTRGSTAICPKQGPATTGILAGDYVPLAINQPRISYVGTLLTYLREEPRTNLVPQSVDFSNAAWFSYTSGVAAVVDNGAVAAPDGLTGRSYTFAATTAGQQSGRGSASVITGCNGVTCAYSFVLMGASGSGSLDLCNGGTGTPCSPCPYVAGTFSVCTLIANVGASASIIIGNETQFSGIARPLQTVIIADPQAEVGPDRSTYIPTGAGSATRLGDSAMTATSSVAVGPRFSIGASFAMTSDTATATTVMQLGTAATDLAQIGRSTSTAASYLINATTTTPAVAAMGITLHRISENDASGTRTAWWDSGSVSAPAASMVGATTAITFGGLNTYTGNVCDDPTPGRCD